MQRLVVIVNEVCAFTLRSCRLMKDRAKLFRPEVNFAILGILRNILFIGTAS